MSDHRLLTIDIEEVFEALNRTFEPLYVDGFKRVRDIQTLITLAAKSYLNRLEVSVFTQLTNWFRLDRDIATIMIALGRLDEILREECLNTLSDYFEYESCRYDPDRCVLIIRFVKIKRPAYRTFEEHIQERIEAGHQIDPSVIKAIDEYEQHYVKRRVLSNDRY